MKSAQYILTLYTVCLLHSFFGFSQTTTDIAEKYGSYFDFPNEALFVHSNKTIYLVGEEVWFQAYVLDKKTTTPSLASSNLFVGIYDEKGIQIVKELFRIIFTLYMLLEITMESLG